MFSAKMKDELQTESSPSSRLSVYFDRSQRDRFKRPLNGPKKKISLSNLLFSSYYTQVLDDNSHQLVIIMYLATRNVESEVNRLVISTGSRMKFPQTTSASLDRHFRRYTHDPRTHLRQTVPPDEEDRNRDRESARNPEEYTEDLVAYHYKQLRPRRLEARDQVTWMEKRGRATTSRRMKEENGSSRREIAIRQCQRWTRATIGTA